MAPLTLSVLPDVFAVARLAPDVAVPAWASAGAFASITRTPEELSVVVADDAVPADVTAERDWRALVIAGPIPFELTGVLAAVLAPLAAEAIPIFALSTYDTDYVLVRAARLERAVEALRAAGHTVA